MMDYKTVNGVHMSSLKAHLNSLDFSSQLEAVKNLIDTAQARTTFWGGRVIEIGGFRSSVALDNVVKKILTQVHFL